MGEYGQGECNECGEVKEITKKHVIAGVELQFCSSCEDLLIEMGDLRVPESWDGTDDFIAMPDVYNPDPQPYTGPNSLTDYWPDIPDNVVEDKPDPTDGEWHSLEAKFNGADVVRVMIDGEDVTDEYTDMPDKYYTFEGVSNLINQFNEKHDLEAKDQGLQLSAEEGELADAILKDNDEEIKEEVGDVMFVAVSIARLKGIDPLEAMKEVTLENMEKDASKEGDKVTKE